MQNFDILWGGKWDHHKSENHITTRRPLKLAKLATSFDIPATICSLVFYCVSFVPTFQMLFNFKMVDSDVSIAI